MYWSSIIAWPQLCRHSPFTLFLSCTLILLTNFEVNFEETTAIGIYADGGSIYTAFTMMRQVNCLSSYSITEWLHYMLQTLLIQLFNHWVIALFVTNNIANTALQSLRGCIVCHKPEMSKWSTGCGTHQKAVPLRSKMVPDELAYFDDVVFLCRPFLYSGITASENGLFVPKTALVARHNNLRTFEGYLTHSSQRYLLLLSQTVYSCV